MTRLGRLATPGQAPRGLRAGVAAALLAVLSGGALADEWSVTPRLTEAVTYRDNPLLRTGDDDQEVFGSQTTLAADLTWRTETSEARFTPSYLVNRYDDLKDALNNEYQYYDLELSSRTERLRYGVTGGLTLDTTTSTEAIEQEGQLGVERVVRDVQVDRNRLSLRPYLSYVLTERTQASLSLDWTSVTYDDDRSAGYVDYDYAVLNASLGYALSERDTVSGILYYSVYEREPFEAFSGALGFQDVTATTTNLGLQIGYEHAFTETLRGSVAVGGVRSEYEADPDILPASILGDVVFLPADTASTEYGQLITASLRQKLERGQWDLDLTRNLSPTGDGFLVSRDEVRTSYRYELDPYTSTRVTLVGLKDENLGSRTDIENRDYARVEAGLSYRLTPYWTLSGRYDFAYQKYENADDSATSSALWVSIAYQGDKWAVSR